MLRLLLLRFWPALIPLALYLIWHELRKRKSRRMGQEPARMVEGPWLWAVSAALMIAVGMMLFYGFTAERRTDVAYEPPQVNEQGDIVRGHFE